MKKGNKLSRTEILLPTDIKTILISKAKARDYKRLSPYVVKILSEHAINDISLSTMEEIIEKTIESKLDPIVQSLETIVELLNEVISDEQED